MTELFPSTNRDHLQALLGGTVVAVYSSCEHLRAIRLDTANGPRIISFQYADFELDPFLFREDASFGDAVVGMKEDMAEEYAAAGILTSGEKAALKDHFVAIQQRMQETWQARSQEYTLNSLKELAERHPDIFSDFAQKWAAE